jgi:CheY-like chemotaxis protein
MFELFTQGTRNPGRAEGGLGIGLALVKSIADLHGGTIEAGSGDDGVGSRFTLSLPLWQQGDDAPARGTPAEPAHAESLSVLVVDDNRDVADSMQVLLELAGHRVQVAYDAAGALRCAQPVPPQVFILDIGMPDMDGYELARRLRGQAGGALFIAITGYGQFQDRQRSAAAGFDHHLVKPVDTEVLGQLLAAHGAARDAAKSG